MQTQDSRTPWMDAAAELDHALRARKGDRRAFAALLRHYHRPAYRLAFALTRDVRAAVAVTRSTVLRARDGIRYMPEGVRFFPWVVQIVRKLARSQRETGASDGAPAERPRAEADVAELAERLQRTMDELDPDAQAALALRVVELLPISLIETTLRVAPGNASSLLAGARWRLTARLGGRGEQRAGHLTPDHLSENLDGALQGFRFNQVRIHLDMCDHCRLQGLRMASTNDVMRALLTHDPADRFHEALERFLEDLLHAKDAPESIPPELDRLIAAEVERIDANRWAAVRHALPRPIFAPVPVAGEEIASTIPAPEATPSHPTPPGAGSPAPPPPTRPPSSPAMASAAKSTATAAWRTVIGAAVVVLILLIAGLYMNQRGTRSRAGVSGPSTAAAPAPAGGMAQAPRVAALPAGPDANPRPLARDSIATSRADRAPAAAPEAKVSAANPPALNVRERKVHVAAETVAAESRMAGAAKPPRAPGAPSPRAPAAAPESGILCGQVRDQSGVPVVGAQVLLADLHVGAVSDRRGRFCISAPVGTRTLSVIALGFTTQRSSVTIEHRTAEVAITLRSEAVQESTRTGGP